MVALSSRTRRNPKFLAELASEQKERDREEERTIEAIKEHNSETGYLRCVG